MKKIYLMLFALVMSFGFLKTEAQVSGYSFSQSSGTYTPIAGTLVAAATDANPTGSPESAPMDDYTFTGISIPFTFRMGGADYTSFNANTNGWISFGSTSTSTSSPISSTNTYEKVIAASAVDLMGVYASSATRTVGSNILTAVGNTTYCKVGAPIQGAGIPAGTTIIAFDATTITISNTATTASTGTYVSWATGEIRTELSGTSPNQVFTVQYSGFSLYSGSLDLTGNNTSLSFQIKLHENGIIDVIYGTYYRAGGSSSPQVGLRGNTNVDYNNRLTTTDWSTTIAGTANNSTCTWSSTVFPASGRIFSWTPNAAAVGWCNIQYPGTATIILGDSVRVYTQAWADGVTNSPGAGANLVAWVGVYGSNTNPSTWPASAWKLAAYNVDNGNNDEDSISIGRTLGAGTYYYASRWQLSGGEYRFGGYSIGGGGFWDGITNVSGVLTITPTLANDICSGAIALTVNTGLTCTASTTGTTVGATQSGEVPTPTCSATGINDDVWYSFVATGASQVVTISGATNTTAINVYSGTCGNLTSMGCSTTTSGALSALYNGLTIGNTYLVRVYSTSSTVGTTTNFTICIGTPPPPPTNDNICNATVLSTSNTSTCTTALTGQTTQWATQSLPGCVGTADEDVWYSFVATNTTHIITLTNSGAGGTDRVHQVFSSSDNTCNGTLTSVGCSDPEFSILSSLTVGNTYFVRVYSYGSGSYSTFDICITSPPSNDNICNATSLSVSGNPTCTTALTSQTTVGATQSLPGCVGTADEDVWYSFVATNTTHIITLTISGAGATDRVHQVFSSSDNTCNGTLTSVGCSDPETSTVNNLIVGNTYFVRVYSYGSGNYSTFDICITSPPACPAPISAAASSVTSTTANANWTPTTGNFIIEYGPTATFTPTGTGAAAGNANNLVVTASNVGTIQLTSLTPVTGYSYVIRQDCNGAGNGYSANSTTRAFTTLDMPPTNDDASGAITITVGAGCSAAPFTNVNATQAINEKFASCYQSATTGSGNTIATHTVWYKFVATGTSVKVTTDITGGTLSDTHLALFSATNANDYSTFTILSCDDDNGVIGGFRSTLYATGLSVGQTYYISVDGFNGGSGTFCLAVDNLTSSMLSSTNTCSSTYQTPNGTQNSYAGQVPLVDASGNLVAIVHNPAGGPVNSYTVAQNINVGAVRQSTATNQYYLDRNYRINNSTATNVDVQFFFLASELAALNTADGTTLATLVADRQNGSTCQNNYDPLLGSGNTLTQTANGTSQDGLVNWIQVTTPSFSNFYLHKLGVALPVAIEYFRGTKQNNRNVLDWKVSCTGSPSVTLVLERSSDGRNYEAIYTASETAARCLQPFAQNDLQPLPGLNYYRLKTIDIDGKIGYSNVVVLIGKDKGFEIISLAPNPVKNDAILTVTSAERTIMEVVVRDINGKQISKQRVNLIAGSNQVPLSMDKVAAGVYTISGLTADGAVRALRFVKQ